MDDFIAFLLPRATRFCLCLSVGEFPTFSSAWVHITNTHWDRPGNQVKEVQHHAVFSRQRLLLRCVGVFPWAQHSTTSWNVCWTKTINYSKAKHKNYWMIYLSPLDVYTKYRKSQLHSVDVLEQDALPIPAPSWHVSVLSNPYQLLKDLSLYRLTPTCFWWHVSVLSISYLLLHDLSLYCLTPTSSLKTSLYCLNPTCPLMTCLCTV